MSLAARVKAVLKPIAVPVWNAVHQLSWHAYDFLGAIAARRFGRCIVCGRTVLFIYRRRVVTPRLEELWGLSPRLADALARKESSDCAHCGAKLRGRRLAQVLLKLYSEATPPAACLARWVELPEIRALRVAEINKIDGVHSFIKKLPAYAGSEFSEESIAGDTVPGTRSEDLTHLTYGDNSFDLIVTSETLEHVPDLGAALREIRRVLAPGGRHVFTVPVLPSTSKTTARATLSPDGTVCDSMPRICHPGGDWGYPVFTEFGTDLPDLLAQAGFQTEVHFGPVREDDLGQVYVCRKPAT